MTVLSNLAMMKALARVVGLNNIHNERVQALSLHEALQSSLSSLGANVERAEEHQEGDVQEKLVHLVEWKVGRELCLHPGLWTYL